MRKQTRNTCHLSRQHCDPRPPEPPQTHSLLPDQRAGIKSFVMRRILYLFPALILASCAPPGRQTFAPNPVGADTQSISAADAFANRIALVSILPNTQDFQAPLRQAVDEALAIKPSAVFEVRAEAPGTGSPDTNIKALAALTPEAEAVARAIIADGVPASRVTVGAKTAGLDPVVLVYVK